MKKIIYPIAAVLVLITAASFSTDHCKGNCTKKDSAKSHVQQTGSRHSQGQPVVTSIAETENQPAIIADKSGQEIYMAPGFDMFNSSFTESDILIDVQFNREETSINIPDMMNGDEALSFQFNAENRPVLAYQPAY